MVKEVVKFQSADGNFFDTIEEAIEHELREEKIDIIRKYFDENGDCHSYHPNAYDVYEFVKEYTKGWK